MAKHVALSALLILLPIMIGVATGRSMPRIFNLNDGERCPAEYFVLNCNNCNCPGGFSPSCTRMLCPPPNIPFYMDGMLCPAGEKFTSDCNECDCHADGKSATCTTNTC